MTKKCGKDSLFYQSFFKELIMLAEKNNYIDSELYEKYNVNRGLRKSDGTGVLTGLTEIGEVRAYIMVDGEKVPQEGRLYYRGIEIKDLVRGFQKENRFGFDEVCYLLLFGELPAKERLIKFEGLLRNNSTLPEGFTRNVILKAPSKNIMNKLGRSVLSCYSYDHNPDDTGIENVLRQCIELIARFPAMAAYGYQAKEHFFEKKSLYIHLPRKELSTAENFLHMIRPDGQYTPLEAEILDLSLVLYAEHGGGHNSTFATHLVSSADTDTYSAIAAATGSLKGTKHGGINMNVIKMIEDIKKHVKNIHSKNEIKSYLVRMLKKEVFDKTGLIHGMGHTVYTLSDPRAVLLKEKAILLAKEKNMESEYELFDLIEKTAPEAYQEAKKTERPICANAGFYSGLVYYMMNIPLELFTPIVAMASILGWSAHRLEEIVSGGRIIRPAYKNVMKKNRYITLSER